MDKLLGWRRWSWDEIYTSLNREAGQGEAFEVERGLVDDPVSCGAERSSSRTSGWDYRFTADDGRNLYVNDLGDRYAAYLEEEGPRLTGDWRLAEPSLPSLSPATMAAWGGFMVFLGSLWVVLESTWAHLG